MTNQKFNFSDVSYITGAKYEKADEFLLKKLITLTDEISFTDLVLLTVTNDLLKHRFPRKVIRQTNEKIIKNIMFNFKTLDVYSDSNINISVNIENIKKNIQEKIRMFNRKEMKKNYKRSTRDL